jgi:hypothetical protein
MSSRVLPVLGSLFLALTAYFAFTGEVRPEGALGDTYLTIKPRPALERYFGGGEEGAWARAHPGQVPPWWQDLNSRPAIYLGDWESGTTAAGALNIFAALLWLGSLFGLMGWSGWNLIRLVSRRPAVVR